ncbi:MAG: exopolysaccharide biosynthesis protein [Alphaproteobacteria bacterium]|jgi:hypothetical protein|nr:exopolysaccharide biosynthesis protein [Alphaproteobacteria bacterium]
MPYANPHAMPETADHPYAQERVATSAIIRDLLKDAPEERVTLDWLLGNLGERSFGILLLFLGMIGLVPGAATFAGLLLFVPAAQMVLGRPAPDLPDFVGARRLPRGAIAWLLRKVAPSLAWIERFTFPRWQTPFRSTRRVIGVVVLLLAATALSPIPFAGVLPSIVIMLLALGLLEKDGVLLAISLALAVVSLAVTAGTVWVSIIAPRYL